MEETGKVGDSQTTNKNDIQEPTISLLTFPQRAHCMLNLVECNHQEHIVSWVNEGAAFKVHGRKEFERDLLPRYFHAKKYTSFTRALHAHGFKCERSGRQTGTFSHPWFKRNQTEMLSLIKRAKPKNNHPDATITDSRISRSAATATSLWRNNSLPNAAHPRPSSSTIFDQQTEEVISSHRSHCSILDGQVAPTTSSSIARADKRDDQKRSAEILPAKRHSPQREEVGSDFYNCMSMASLEPRSILHNHCSILDDQVAPITSSSSARADKRDNQKRSAEILPATQHSPQREEVGSDFNNCISMASLEPRSIQAMEKSPSDLNQYRRFCSSRLNDKRR